MCYGRLYEQFIFISRSNIIKLVFLISTLFDTHFLFSMSYKNIFMLSLNAIFRIFYSDESTITENLNHVVLEAAHFDWGHTRLSPKRG